MKTLYIECNMGAAGDMLTAALLELHPDPQGFLSRLNAIGLKGVSIAADRVKSKGIEGTRMSVTVNGVEETCPEDMHKEEHGHAHEHGHEHEHTHEHSHSHEGEHAHEHAHASLGDINRIIDGLTVSQGVKKHVKEVYSLIAGAESRAHGTEVGEVHFHEVGAMDAIADITAVSMLIEELAPERVLASPVCVGFGQVKTAHGVLPVPAPATAALLEEIPIYGGHTEGELCTPTGAALIRSFACGFCAMPGMKILAVGYGIGKKEFAEAANFVRAFMGETDADTETAAFFCEPEEITELVCNVDDMTPEAAGFAQERLFEAGARDVYIAPVYMKKNRPGFMIGVICAADKKRELIEQMFLHTSTLGVREYTCVRHTLDREEYEKNTPYGPVRIKRAQGYGVTREKPEYEDVADIAREHGWSLAEAARKAGV